MRVLYDFQAFSMQRYGGVSRYVYEVASHLRSGHSEVDVEFAGRFADNDYVDALGIKASRALHRYQGRGRGALVALADRMNARAVERRIDRGGVDAYHPTYFRTVPPARRDGPAVVVTVHDMIHELFEGLPDAVRVREMKRLAVERADAVVAVSAHTKSDLQRLLGVPAEKVVVIHHGCTFTGEERGNDSLRPPQRYVLYVGSRLGYKNFSAMVEAMVPAMREDPGLHVVCAGGGPLTEAELSLARGFGFAERLSQTPADDPTLVTLYREATLFVCPSLYEGFGLPLLEAMTFGCPVATSNAASLPEVGGDAVRYFDPASVDDMADAISSLLADGGARAHLSTAGKARASQFSWDASADAHAKLYSELSSRSIR